MLLSIHAIYEFSRGCEIIMSNLQWRHKYRKVHFNWYCNLCTHLGEIAPLAHLYGTFKHSGYNCVDTHLYNLRAFEGDSGN